MTLRRWKSSVVRLALLTSVFLTQTIYSYTQTAATVVTDEANAIAASSAELHGTFNPGGRPMAAFFEWGTSTALGNTTEYRTLMGSSAVTAGRSISNLQPRTTYYFRAVGRT